MSPSQPKTSATTAPWARCFSVCFFLFLPVDRRIAIRGPVDFGFQAALFGHAFTRPDICFLKTELDFGFHTMF